MIELRPGQRRSMILPPSDPRMLPIRLRRELLRDGHTDRTLAQNLKSGAFARPRRGAYVDGRRWADLSVEEQYAIRCRAAARQACTSVILSHVSALPFHGAPIWGFSLRDAHMTREDGLSGRREAGVQQHCGTLLDGDVIRDEEFAVMSPIRATLEASMLGSVEAAVVVANHFLHARTFDLPSLAARYDDAMARWPYSLGTDLMMRLADPRVESVGESRTSYFFYKHSLPKPIPQFEVYDGSALVARLDFALPDFGIWVEFDGRTKYERHLRQGESVTDAVLREKRREERVAELTGWRCLRITWADLAEPVRLDGRVRALIDSVATARRRRTG